MSTFATASRGFRSSKAKSAKTQLQHQELIKPHTRRTLTLNEIAGERLRRALEKFPDTTAELRRQLVDEMVPMDLLSTMNMDILAAALMFLHRTHGRIDPAIYTSENIRQVLFVKLSSTNEDMYVSYATDLLRYIFKVQTYRNLPIG